MKVAVEMEAEVVMGWLILIVIAVCGAQSNQVFQRERYKDILRKESGLLAANAVGLGNVRCVGLCWL